MKKNEKKNYKKIAIIAIIIILILTIIIVIINKLTKNNELKFNEFEKTAIYGYLENNVLDVETLYKISGKSEFNEMQTFQAKLKLTLDKYFKEHEGNSVSTSTILELIDSKYIPKTVDFHGIIMSNYEFNANDNTFVKSKNTNLNIAIMESQINQIDYTNRKASVEKIEKETENKYKITFNIINNQNIENSGNAVILLENGKFTIEDCKFDD